LLKPVLRLGSIGAIYGLILNQIFGVFSAIFGKFHRKIYLLRVPHVLLKSGNAKNPPKCFFSAKLQFSGKMHKMGKIAKKAVFRGLRKFPELA